MDLTTLLSESLSLILLIYEIFAAVSDYISTLIVDIDYSSLIDIFSNLISSLA